MTKVELLAKLEGKLRPYLLKLSPEILTAIYSPSRKIFVSLLSTESTDYYIRIPESEQKNLWGLKFRSGLLNAAGIFKYGEGYRTVAGQGAGAYLAGTSTYRPRRGNQKKGIMHPFLPFPKSMTAVNWMGLPNDGHESLARKISVIEKMDGCPIGVSIASNPEDVDKEAVSGICEGLKIFKKAGADFLELNESCPNVPHNNNHSNSVLDSGLIERLEAVSRFRIQSDLKNLPIIIKLSNDTAPEQIPELLETLLTLGYDGINFGNTSTDYQNIKVFIADAEHKAFDYFVGTFGGGISGKLLKEKSYALASLAAGFIKTKSPAKEFHVIRTGGISSLEDLRNSDSAGISLNQWFTGYFENFAHYGHKLYIKLFSKA